MKISKKLTYSTLATLVFLFQFAFSVPVALAQQVSYGGISINMNLSYTKTGQFWNFTNSSSTTVTQGDYIMINEATTFSGGPFRGTLNGIPNQTSVIHWVASNCPPAATCQQWTYREGDGMTFPWFVVSLTVSYTPYLTIQTTGSTPPGTYVVNFLAEENPVTWPAPLMTPASKSFTLTVVAPPVAGSCGTANGKIYPSGTTVYAPDTQCATGTSTNTAFPAVGSSTSWICNGTGGGANSGSCSASRSAAAINGTLGTANGKTYPNATVSYAPDTQCVTGTSTNIAFPASGGSTTWVCNGANGGTNSGIGTASRAAPLVMSGTLTPATSTCSIASGASSCTINFSWTTTNPVATSAVTSDTNNSGGSSPNFNVANGNSGGPTAFTIPYPNRNFFLYNNAVLLASASGGSITATCVAGTFWDGVKCAVNPISVSLSANPTSMTLPTNSTTLTWATTGSPTSCTASNGWNGAKAPGGGSEVQSGLTSGPHTYTITCSKAGATDATSSVAVSVSVATTATLSANPLSIYSGNSTVLTWSSNAASCIGTNFDAGGAASGNVTLSPTVTTIYQVTCGGVSSSTVTVTVKRKPVIKEN
jgi:hypothetical protein